MLKLLDRRSLASNLALVLVAASLIIAVVPTASAQTQYLEATPGYINLGMTTSILVTAPTANTYAVVVQQPNGMKATLNFTFTAAGQMMSATYGNSSLGFQAAVDQVGTYNVFLEHLGQVVSSTSFYATNKLLTSFQMVVGGTCEYVSGVERGSKMFPHIFITYASNGTPMTNTAKGAFVQVLAPSGQVTTAYWDPYAKGWEIGVLPNWNYTYIGPWNPVINSSDAAGNTGEFKYTGSPFVISPVELSTSIVVVNATSGLPVTSLQNGQTVTIKATISYPTNAEPVVGFVAPLDPTRGGSVSVQVGWGYYNATSGTFGGKTPGGLLGIVPMTYTGANGTWAGQFVSSSLPKLQPGTNYMVVVSSKDSASPANTGFATEILSPSTVTAIPTTVTQTQTTTTQTTVTQTNTQIVQTIPDAVYAALAILLVVGVIIGYIVRVPKVMR